VLSLRASSDPAPDDARHRARGARAADIEGSPSARRRQPALEKRLEHLKPVFEIARVLLENEGRIEAFFFLIRLANKSSDSSPQCNAAGSNTAIGWCGSSRASSPNANAKGCSSSASRSQRTHEHLRAWCLPRIDIAICGAASARGGRVTAGGASTPRACGPRASRARSGRRRCRSGARSRAAAPTGAGTGRPSREGSVAPDALALPDRPRRLASGTPTLASG